ncbi:hypothetical protein M0R45_009329 [Rubus argutus]|uniref:Uncharacterized protein n=1 Tax=Rubus argutus TaxID=59490 RepID=A0AAW1Y4K7_RUBAR
MMIRTAAVVNRWRETARHARQQLRRRRREGSAVSLSGSDAGNWAGRHRGGRDGLEEQMASQRLETPAA